MFAHRKHVSADYQQLLHRGYVVRRYRNALGWLSAINAEARADGLGLESSIAPLDRDVAWALLKRMSPGDLMVETSRVLLLHELAVATAAEHAVDELDVQLD